MIEWIGSFDIGKKNFSFYIESFDQETLLNLQSKNIVKNKRYNPNNQGSFKSN